MLDYRLMNILPNRIVYQNKYYLLCHCRLPRAAINITRPNHGFNAAAISACPAQLRIHHTAPEAATAIIPITSNHMRRCVNMWFQPVTIAINNTGFRTSRRIHWHLQYSFRRATQYNTINKPTADLISEFTTHLFCCLWFSAYKECTSIKMFNATILVKASKHLMILTSTGLFVILLRRNMWPKLSQKVTIFKTPNRLLQCGQT